MAPASPACWSRFLFRDPSTTRAADPRLAGRRPPAALFDSTINSGILIAIAAVLLVHLLMTRTAFGLKLRIVGANPRAAASCRVSMWQRLTFATFALSAGLAGLAGAVEILGVQGTMRADWNPAYGLLVVPLVFLARFHAARRHRASRCSSPC